MATDDEKDLEPGEVAAILRVSTSTVRRYEQRGLIRPRRTLGSKHRRYDAQSVAELRSVNQMPEGPQKDAMLEALRRRNLQLPEPEPDAHDPTPQDVAEHLLRTMSRDDLREVFARLAKEFGDFEKR